jgi:hypothetical protein
MNLFDKVRWIKIGIVVAGVLIFFGLITYFVRHQPKISAGTSNDALGYKPIVCLDADEKDHSKENPQYVLVKLQPGCFSGFITVPDTWHTWQHQMAEEGPKDWVAEWYAGWEQPQGPWMANRVNGGLVPLNNTTRKVRVQGQGTFVLYRITGDEGQVKEKTKETHEKSGKDQGDTPNPTPTVDATPAPATAMLRKPTPPVSGLGTGYTFVIDECHRSGERVLCSGKAANTTDASSRLSSYTSRAVDDEGNSIQVNGVQFSDGNILQKLMPNVPVSFTIFVDDPHQNAKKLNFELHVSFEGASGFDNLVFKDIPIQ